MTKKTGTSVESLRMSTDWEDMHTQKPCIAGESDNPGAGDSQAQQDESAEIQLKKRLYKRMILNKEIEELKKQVKLKKAQSDKSEKAKLEAAKSKLTETFSFQPRNGKVIEGKAAYLRHNRLINDARVNEFIALIRAGKYLADYPIIVARASKFLEIHPEIELVDANGNSIPVEDLENYFIFFDGQHRGRAHMLLISLGESTVIPGVIIKDDIMDVAEFLRSINPKGSWSNSDEALVCGLTVTGKYQPLMEEIEKLVRRGFNRSTASQIFCGKPLTSQQFKTLLGGEEPKKGVAFNIEKGRDFVESCHNAGISDKYLTKRHFIEGYLDMKTSKGEDFADLALHSLPTLSDAQLKAIKSKTEFVEILTSAHTECNASRGANEPASIIHPTLRSCGVK